MVKKILVVDDEPHILKLIKSRLVANKYEVVTASDGEECLSKIMSENPDLVILDMMMPKMDGYDVLVALKESWVMSGRVTKIPPVIVLTGSVDPKIQELLERDLVKAFMIKPFKSQDLLEAIQRI